MPTQSKEAPGKLALVRAFINTLDIDLGTEELADADALAAWLEEGGLSAVGTRADRGDLQRALALREALRELLLSNNDGRPVEASIPAALDAVTARAGLRLHVGSDGRMRLEAEGSGVDVALGRLLVIVYRSMEAGTWPRLKSCRNDTCKWAFYDHSKNRSGHWCTMSVCGNRQKAKQYRERHKVAAHKGE